jgi:hypothetical protein
MLPPTLATVRHAESQHWRTSVPHDLPIETIARLNRNRN